MQDAPTFRPGGWDLPFRGPLLVELDEELHFNCYRATTLEASWEADLPWTALPTALRRSRTRLS